MNNDKSSPARADSEPTPESLLPHEYLFAKLAMVMPLFQEARDAITAIREDQRIRHGIRKDLADRMDIAGTFSLDDWEREFPARAALASVPAHDSARQQAEAAPAGPRWATHAELATFWQGEARRFAQNADFWRKRCEAIPGEIEAARRATEASHAENSRAIVAQLKCFADQERSTQEPPTAENASPAVAEGAEADEPVIARTDKELTRKVMIDFLVQRRQDLGGSVSEHNHRRNLETQSTADLRLTYRRIEENERRARRAAEGLQANAAEPALPQCVLDLLAVLNADGGHFLDEHGLEAACKRAEERYYEVVSHGQEQRARQDATGATKASADDAGTSRGAVGLGADKHRQHRGGQSSPDGQDDHRDSGSSGLRSQGSVRPVRIKVGADGNARPEGFDYTKPDIEEERCKTCNRDGMNRTGWLPYARIGASTTGGYAIYCPARCDNGLDRRRLMGHAEYASWTVPTSAEGANTRGASDE